MGGTASMVALVAAAALAVLPGFREAPSLEPAASYVAGKPVLVYVGGAYGEGGHAYPGSSEVYIDETTFAALRAALAHRTFYEDYVAASLLVLAHEAVHASGVADESQTECAALARLPGMASRFFGFRTWRARHDLMDLAWGSHRGLPQDYQRLC